jgi:hypothetical protein
MKTKPPLGEVTLKLTGAFWSHLLGQDVPGAAFANLAWLQNGLSRNDAGAALHRDSAYAYGTASGARVRPATVTRVSTLPGGPAGLLRDALGVLDRRPLDARPI